MRRQKNTRTCDVCGKPTPRKEARFCGRACWIAAREPSRCFWVKVDRRGPDECWLWQAGCNGDGYGSFRGVGAHVFAYREIVGEIATGLELDHLCRNRRCVNPAHLEPVTSGENTRRGEAGSWGRAKTHCPHGHEYTPENTERGSHGQRRCIACARKATRETQRRLRALLKEKIMTDGFHNPGCPAADGDGADELEGER